MQAKFWGLCERFLNGEKISEVEATELRADLERKQKSDPEWLSAISRHTIEQLDEYINTIHKESDAKR